MQKAKEYASNFLLNNLMPSQMGSMDQYRGELLVAESCSVTFLYIPYHIELLLTSGIHVGPPYECQGKGPVP